MRLALISKSRVAGLFVPLGPPPGLILTVGHVGCNWRCANLAVNAFLVPPQLYTVGIDINVKIADMAYLVTLVDYCLPFVGLRSQTTETFAECHRIGRPDRQRYQNDRHVSCMRFELASNYCS